MAAKPYDHDKSKYVENISHEMGHILGMFHDSSSNGLGFISNLRFLDNDGIKGLQRTNHSKNTSMQQSFKNLQNTYIGQKAHGNPIGMQNFSKIY